MASLTETLATAKPTKSAYSAAGYGSAIPRIQSPYPAQYGARVSYGPQSTDQGLYANLLARTQQESARALPSATYNAQYNYDPILARLTALSQMALPNARDEAANLRKRALIETGDEALATELAADDPNTIAAAKANEFGTRQLLDRDYKDRSRQADEALNNANLFFGGTRIDELAKQQFGMRQAETDYLSKFREMFAGIGQQLLMREEQERQALIDAQIRRGFPAGGIGAPVPGAAAPVAPVAAPVAAPAVNPNAGSWLSAPVAMESPGAMYIPGIGFRAPVYDSPEFLATLGQMPRVGQQVAV
jgi:hypothetical protein